MKNTMVYMLRMACRMFCVLVLVCGMVSCDWHEAGKVVAQAEMLDKTEHLIYDDTASLGRTIRCLDNPVGRLLMSNTLGKAYYFMGRNYSLSNQIAEAAGCYIEADRLQIDDPIYRGRVNSCMGYICAQNDNDSLALIFYERSNNAFKESGNEWYYAQSLLNVSQCHVYLHRFGNADSLLNIAQTYQLDSAYMARYYETNGLYFYELHQYDSALVYFNRGLNYWRSEEEKCFSYLKIMQIGIIDMQDFESTVSYAQYIVDHSNNPNYLSNAYYCLMQDAKMNDNTLRLSQYAHAREDANRLLNRSVGIYAEAIPKLRKYIHTPHPWRWVWATISSFSILSILLVIGIFVYKKNTTLRLQVAQNRISNLSEHLENERTIHKEDKRYLEFSISINSLLIKYPQPRKQWINYKQLKQDIAPWLYDWICELEKMELSNAEYIFCIYSMLYPHFSMQEMASYMHYSYAGLRVLKSRLLKKMNISSMNFHEYLKIWASKYS